MSRFRRRRPLVWMLALLACGYTLGCGSGAPTGTGATSVESLALSEFGEAYRAYQIAKKKPPATVADLTSIENIGGNGVASVKAGTIIVNWGAALPDTDETPGKTPSSEVLAYEKSVPESGGAVLLLDRTVKQMTADEFKAAPKAGGK